MSTSGQDLGVCNTCDMHSQPARALNAFWKRAVAFSAATAHGFAIVLAANRQNTSLTTIPLTPPCGFFRALRRATKLEGPSGTHNLWQRALRHGTRDLCPCPTSTLVGVFTSHSGRSGAAPLRALRTLRQKTSSSRSKGLSGTHLATSGGKSSRVGVPGTSTHSMLLLPGANPVDSKACRAADNSPTKIHSSCSLAVTVLASPLANSCRCNLTGNVHAVFRCPEKNISNRASNFFCGTNRPRHGRLNNMRGKKKKKSFPPRSCLCSSPRSWPVGYLLQRHAQCCAETAFLEERSGFHRRAQSHASSSLNAEFISRRSCVKFMVLKALQCLIPHPIPENCLLPRGSFVPYSSWWGVCKGRIVSIKIRSAVMSMTSVLLDWTTTNLRRT